MLLCNYLHTLHNVTVVCLESQQPDEFSYQCRIIRLEIPRRITIAGKILVGTKRIKALRQIKSQLNTDVSIAFGNTAIILNALAGTAEIKMASIRQSLSGMKKEKSLKSKFHQLLYKWALRNADKIVPVSEAINHELFEYFNIKNKYFIHNGYDFEEIRAKASEPILQSYANKFWLVHSGRFDLSKGHWHLIKIFVEVKKQCPGTGLMLIGGVDGSAETGNEIFKFCKDFIESNQLKWAVDDPDADVIFLGHQSNPFKFISKAGLYVMPSLWEGFPNALVEAMICGIPVVAADCSTGPREILKDQSTGMYYGLLLPAFTDKFNKANHNTDKLDYYWAGKISNMIRDDMGMQLYKQRSIERSKEYSVEKYGKSWLNIIEEKEKCSYET